MNSIKLGEWGMWIEDGMLPSTFRSYVGHAEFVDQIDLNNSEGRFLFLGFSKGNTANEWPSVVVAQRYQDSQRIFSPGVLLIPDTSLAFVGAGERLLCYNIEEKRRLWEDETDYGFLEWCQFGPYVLMSAEVEFGVWDQFGEKLWSTFVEPPWDYQVRGKFVELTVMGDTSIYRLSDGLRQV